MSDVILSIQGLAFSFPQRHVLLGLNARIGPGLTWLRGPNGSGKSTLLSLLAGALVPLAGQIRVDGRCPQADHLAYRQRVFWCGPGALAFDHLTATEYLAFMAGLYPTLDVAQARAHFMGLGLAPHLGTRLAALSTGTQRKVWLATSLAVGTRLVLVDEPLNALDAASLAYFQQALRQACQRGGQAWLVSSHEAPCGEGFDAASLVLGGD